MLEQGDFQKTAESHPETNNIEAIHLATSCFPCFPCLFCQRIDDGLWDSFHLPAYTSHPTRGNSEDVTPIRTVPHSP